MAFVVVTMSSHELGALVEASIVLASSMPLDELSKKAETVAHVRGGLSIENAARRRARQPFQPSSQLHYDG